MVDDAEIEFDDDGDYESPRLKTYITCIRPETPEEIEQRIATYRLMKWRQEARRAAEERATYERLKAKFG